METSPGNAYPRLCVDAGLSCEACTEATATELAQVCKGLRGKMIGQMFVQIHTDPACARMHSHFVEAYRVANSTSSLSQLAAAVEVPAPPRPGPVPRRGPVPERRRTMVAVA